MDRGRLDEVARRLPLFPLARTVLMPGGVLPLHVFEPRYRALVEHCLATDRIMGIATLDGRSIPDPHAPVLYPEVGVGEIVSHQPFPDGRCNLVLQYVGSARYRRDLPSPHPFRLGDCTLLPEGDPALEPAYTSLKVLVLQLSGQVPAAGGEARRLVELEGQELADALARRLLTDPDVQRVYLGSTPRDRLALVSDRLAGFLVTQAPVGIA